MTEGVEGGSGPTTTTCVCVRISAILEAAGPGLNPLLYQGAQQKGDLTQNGAHHGPGSCRRRPLLGRRHRHHRPLKLNFSLPADFFIFSKIYFSRKFHALNT